MHSGKKSIAAGIVYDAMKTIEERTGSTHSKRLKSGAECYTLVEVKARRVGVPPTSTDGSSC